MYPCLDSLILQIYTECFFVSMMYTGYLKSGLDRCVSHLNLPNNVLFYMFYRSKKSKLPVRRTESDIIEIQISLDDMFISVNPK